MRTVFHFAICCQFKHCRNFRGSRSPRSEMILYANKHESWPDCQSLSLPSRDPSYCGSRSSLVVPILSPAPSHCLTLSVGETSPGPLVNFGELSLPAYLESAAEPSITSRSSARWSQQANSKVCGSIYAQMRVALLSRLACTQRMQNNCAR